MWTPVPACIIVHGLLSCFTPSCLDVRLQRKARQRLKLQSEFCSIQITFTAVSNHSNPFTQWHRPQRTWESVFFLFTGAPLTTQLNARLRASFQSPKQDWLQLPSAFHTVWLPHHLHPVGRMDLSSSRKYCECREQSFPKDSPWPWSSLLKRHKWTGATLPQQKAARSFTLSHCCGRQSRKEAASQTNGQETHRSMGSRMFS